MNPDDRYRRYPWAALALSFLSAGLGHIYCGRAGKGLILFCAWFLLPVLALVASLLAPSRAVLVLLILAPAIGVFALYLYAATDAFITARRIGKDYAIKEYNRALVYVMLIAVGLIYPLGITTATRALVFEAFRVAARSMHPGLLEGDRVLVNKLVGRGALPQRGDVVAFRNPGAGAPIFLKRVIALPGDTIEVRDRSVVVNGQPLPHDRVPPESLLAIEDYISGDVFCEVNSARRYQVMYRQTGADNGKHRNYATATVPPQQLFLLGDHRDNSRDSRDFGFVPLRDVIGHVQYVFGPAASWSRFGAVWN